MRALLRSRLAKPLTYLSLIFAIELVPLVTFAHGRCLVILLQDQHDLPVPGDLGACHIGSRFLGSSERAGQIALLECAPPTSHENKTPFKAPRRDARRGRFMPSPAPQIGSGCPSPGAPRQYPGDEPAPSQPQISFCLASIVRFARRV